MHTTNANLANKHGDTALIRACRSGHLNCVTKLLEEVYQTNIYAWNNYEESALVAAMGCGNKDIVRKLLQRDNDLAGKVIIKAIDPNPAKWVI